MTKKTRLTGLMKRKGGVSIEAAAKSLNWQRHTVRSALWRLRTEEYAIERAKTNKRHFLHHSRQR